MKNHRHQKQEKKSSMDVKHLEKHTLARLAIPATGRKCWGHKGDTTSRPAPMSYITSAVHCTHIKPICYYTAHTASATVDCPPKVNTESEGACTNKKGLHTKYAPAFWFRVHACTHAAAYQLPKMLHPILQHLSIYSSKVSNHDQPFTSNNRWSSPTTTLPPNLFTPLKPGLGCSRSTSKLCLTIEQAGTHFYHLYLVSAGKPAYMVSKI